MCGMRVTFVLDIHVLVLPVLSVVAVEVVEFVVPRHSVAVVVAAFAVVAVGAVVAVRLFVALFRICLPHLVRSVAAVIVFAVVGHSLFLVCR